MYLEHIITEYNKPLTFKLIAFFLLSLPGFQHSSQFQNILFSLVTPSYSCLYNTTEKNFTVSQDQCFVNVNGTNAKCNNWNFSNNPIGMTMVSEYKLVCDRKFYTDIIQISWYLTFLTGPLMGMLSDQFGRKKVVLFCLWLETVSSILIVLAPTVISHIAIRICLGISGSGVYISYIWLLEIVDLEFRPFVGSFFWFYWSIAYMSFPLMSYLTHDWRFAQLISIFTCPLYLMILLMPESPRWLCVTNRQSELMSSLRQIAKFNRLKIEIINENISVKKSFENDNIINALKDQDFTFRAMFALLTYLSVNVLYLSTVFNITLLSSNLFLSVFLLGLMELPSLVLTYFSLKYVKRKTVFFTFGVVGASLFFISSFVNANSKLQIILVIVLGCIAKIAITTTNQNTIVYLIELLPTSHRSFGLTIILITNVISNFGATYINRLSEIFQFLPMLIYFVFLSLTAFITFFGLPETKDLPIPETLTDLKRLRRGKENKYRLYMNNKTHFTNGNFSDQNENNPDTPDEKTKLIENPHN